MHRVVSTLLRTLTSGVLLALASAVSAADKPSTPTSGSGFAVISAEEANALVGKASFFDMRSAINYGKGHIRSAKALPYGEKSAYAPDFDPSVDRFDMSKLPADKGTPIVFYSDGPKGWKSYKAAVLASKAGYKNVKWMREGTAGWQVKGYPLAN